MQSRHLASCLASLWLGLGLSGCGNAYQSLEERGWKPVGRAAIPSVPFGTSSPDLFRPSVLSQGTGREIEAGTAIQLRITALSGALRDPRTLKKLPQAEGWFWIGTAERPDGKELVDLGSALLRVSLVGLREDATLRFYAKGAFLGLVTLPRRGFLLPFAYKSDWARLVPSGQHEWLDEDYVQVAGEGEYEMKVLRVCDGRLTAKTGTLKQWGFVWNWGDSHYKFARDGILEWAALDIDCPRSEKLRFEKGPAHGLFTPGYRDNPLLSWQGSYESASKPGRFF